MQSTTTTILFLLLPLVACQDLTGVQILGAETYALALGLSFGLALVVTYLLIFFFFASKAGGQYYNSIAVLITCSALKKNSAVKATKDLVFHHPNKPTCCGAIQRLELIRRSALVVPAISITCVLPFHVVGVLIPETGLIGAAGVMLIVLAGWVYGTAQSLGLNQASSKFPWRSALIQLTFSIVAAVFDFIVGGIYIGFGVTYRVCSGCDLIVEAGIAAGASTGFSMTGLIFVAVLFQEFTCLYIWLACFYLSRNTKADPEQNLSSTKRIENPIVHEHTEQLQSFTANSINISVLIEKNGQKVIANIPAVHLRNLEDFNSYLFSNGFLLPEQVIEVWSVSFEDWVLLNNTALLTQNSKIRII